MTSPSVSTEFQTLNSTSERSLTNARVWATNSSYAGPDFPLMHFSPEEMAEMNSNSALASAGISSATETVPVATGAKNLLSYFTYNIPTQRNQGSCGNCWVWASTAALEIDHAVKDNVYDRLSVQYFDSKYNKGASACAGGNLDKFTAWYASDHTPVPWSNLHAEYGDAGAGTGPSLVSISSISTTPHYQLNTVSDSYVNTFTGSQSDAINAIKTQLNANKAVEYSFFYGSSGWNDFQNFWSSSNETTIFDPTPHAGETETGGHAVLIVGYDDSTDPGNPYWLVLNSWGASSKRPNGMFRLKMNMNYGAVCYYVYNGQRYSYEQHTFQILNSSFDSTSTGPTIVGITPSSELNSSQSFITHLSGTNYFGTPVVKLNLTGFNDVVATDVTVVSSTNIRCTFNLTGRPAARYNVVIINPDGQQAILPRGFIVMAVPSTKIGIYHDGAWYLDEAGTGNAATATFHYFGAPGWTPVLGDWNGDGKTEIGIENRASWYQDMEGTGNPAISAYYYFGASGWMSIVGNW